ncbi:MAG: hypothetical protein A2583_02255 [Bdellovibrionales bacterium RIFOXYD1_FULL_53_11]|nr:MAG: hypothetical protein A2583_02255 [Bdellovibrionales bacterium RIFOXYD1_FULL_53_11]
MRELDLAAVAKVLVSEIKQVRTAAINPSASTPVLPDGKRRAYIIDSLKHPAEVYLLRHVYGSAFTLIGIVVADEETRIVRVKNKLKLSAADENSKKEVINLLERDRDSGKKHGQRVADTFHLADYFLDNTADAEDPVNYEIPDQLSRLIKIITHSEIMRPTSDETAMFVANGASLQSACLSRQVGACIVNADGDLVSTGKNEPPQAGGGVYTQQDNNSTVPTTCDGRCGFLSMPANSAGGHFQGCSNINEQNTIIEKILAELPELNEPSKKEDNKRKIREGSIGDLLEFSRAVHAEMTALLVAAKTGRVTQGCRMFVTTFPCHYCARHIVCAGIDEVQYIEPYPKSKALSLHFDAITSNRGDWTPPSQVDKTLLAAKSAMMLHNAVSEKKVSEIEFSKLFSKVQKKVLFRPFTGVAPRLYGRVFRQDRKLKDKLTGEKKIQLPEWSDPWYIGKISYIELEALLSGEQK